ncbi:MAG: WD40 repeat domain-containing protein, partial [Deltaproteobacteria bacterium]
MGWAAKVRGSALQRYGFRLGIPHLLADGRVEEAASLVTDFDAQFARRLSEADQADVDRWVGDCGAVMRRTKRHDVACWADFARTNRHHFRKEGWELWRVLFQAAMDHADYSAVTLAAELYETAGRRDWAWLRWVNRPAQWRRSALVAVCVGHSADVNGALEMPDGRILSWSDDHSLRLWDRSSGMPVAVLELEGHTRMVNGAVVLVDGSVLSWSDDGTLRLWDGASGESLAVLEGHTDSVNGAQVLSDGRILSWSADQTLRVWDSSSGACPGLLEGHSASVNGAQALPDSRILSWSDDNTLRLWDPASGALVAVLEGHCEKVTDADVLPSDHQGLFEFKDEVRRKLLLGAASGRELASLGPFERTDRRGAPNVRLLPDGRVLSWSGDGTLRVWDTGSDAPPAVLESEFDPALGALVLADGRVVLWSVLRGLRIWDASSGTFLAVLEGHTDRVSGALALADNRIMSWSDDGTLRVWDTNSGSTLVVLEGHAYPVNGALALADGRILSWSEDETLRVWDSNSGEPLAVLERH